MDLFPLMQPITKVFQCITISILNLIDQISLIQSTSLHNSCISPWAYTSQLLSIYYDIPKAPCVIISFSNGINLLSSFHFLMLTRLAIRVISLPPLPTLFTSVVMQFPSALINKNLQPTPLQRLSIVPLFPPSLKLYGFVLFQLKLVSHYLTYLPSTMTILVPPMSVNLVFHYRMKHIVRDHVTKRGSLCSIYFHQRSVSRCPH